jgi:hypothetical protein
MLRNLMASGLLSISFQSIGGELLKDEAIPSRLRTPKNKPSYNFTTATQCPDTASRLLLRCNFR